MAHNYPPKICLKCKKKYQPLDGRQKYCGSVQKKRGCSYEMRKQRSIESAQKSYRLLKLTNPEKWRARFEKIKEWRIKNSEKYKAQRKRQIERMKQKRQENPEKYREEDKRKYEHRRGVLKWKRLKLRFKILSRDYFTCQYCGKKTPSVELEIDHIYPNSKGGKSVIENYITTCRECNIGKGDVILNEFKL